MQETIIYWIKSIGLKDPLAFYLSKGILVVLILFIAWILNLIARFILFRIIKKITLKTKNNWDDILYEQGMIKKIARLIPALSLYIMLSLIFLPSPLLAILNRIILSYMIGLGIWICFALMNAIDYIYRNYEISRKRPIKGYLQILKIFILIVGAIIIISTLINKSPWGIIAGLSAMTAVLMLIFKDTLLGLVAGIQLNSNNMLQIGDFITINGTDIDGEVIDISLHSVQILNYDKTVSMIPTYYLVTNAYKNWKGIKETGVRRLKKALFIDMNSVKFVNGSFIKRLIEQKEISHYIPEIELKENESITNLTVFRLFITKYLTEHPRVSQNFSIIVRHLDPTPTGLPLELYLYMNEKELSLFENLQAGVLDYLIACIPLFELKIFQMKSID